MLANLYLDGSGSRGFYAFAGAVAGLQEAGYTFKNVAGAGSGAWIAALVAAGFEGQSLIDCLQLPRAVEAPLYIILSDVHTGQAVRWPDEVDIPLISALSDSMLIPAPGVKYADGALFSRYPVHIFDNLGEDIPTFGVKLYQNGELFHLKNIYDAVVLHLQSNCLSPKAAARTMIVPVGNINASDSPDEAQQAELFASGHSMAKRFLEIWDFDLYQKLYKRGCA